MSNLLNINHRHITFTVYDNFLSCRYETAISNENDFIKEFDLAFQVIGETIESYNRIFPDLKRDYPNVSIENNGNIGFIKE